MNSFIFELVHKGVASCRPCPSPPAAAAGGLRERNKRDKWTRIQRAARAIFSRDGFDAATLRAIAARAGVATGTLFLYARDKRALLFLVFQDESRRIFAEARADADATTRRSSTR